MRTILSLYHNELGNARMTRDPRTADELSIHCAIVDLLRVKALPKLIYFHPANEGERSIKTGGKLKAMGMVPGTPDLAFVLPDGHAAFMEVKRRGGVRSPAQLAFAARCEDIGVAYVVVNSVDMAEGFLWGWGALKGPAPVRRAA